MSLSDIKKEYIVYKEKSIVFPKNYLQNVLSKAESNEEALGKDLSDWSADEIIEYYKGLHSTSAHTLFAMNCRLAEYADYLNRLHNKKHNNYNDISYEIIEECVDREKQKQRFVSYEIFKRRVSDNVANAVDKFILTCLFEGIKGKGFEEIWKLKLENITERKVKLSSGKEIELMTPDLYHLAHEAADTFQYYTHSDTVSALEMFGNRDQIIKMVGRKQQLVVNDDPKMIERQNKNIFRKFERCMEDIGWSEVRPRSLLISGQIQYAKNLANNNNLSIEQLLDNKDLFQKLQNRFIKITSKKEFLNCVQYVGQ